MNYKKEKPIKGGLGGCACCGYQYEILPSDVVIAVGFGYASVTKNGEEIYNEDCVDSDRYWTCQTAENKARKDPENDWRIHLVGPLSERHYQRQGDNNWVLYKKSNGFA